MIKIKCKWRQFKNYEADVTIDYCCNDVGYTGNVHDHDLLVQEAAVVQRVTAKQT